MLLPKGRLACLCAVVFYATLRHGLRAQTNPVTPEQEYKKLIRVSEDIQPLGENPFGENISLYDGSLSFEQTDVSLAGNGPALPLRRRFNLPEQQARSNQLDNAIG